VSKAEAKGSLPRQKQLPLDQPSPRSHNLSSVLRAWRAALSPEFSKCSERKGVAGWSPWTVWRWDVVDATSGAIRLYVATYNRWLDANSFLFLGGTMVGFEAAHWLEGLKRERGRS
jgi:hypothetical protein